MALRLYIDTRSRGNPGPAGIGLVLQDDAGRSLRQAGRFLGPLTELEAVVHGLLAGLEAVESHAAGQTDSASEIAVFSCSEWLVRQLTGQGLDPDESLGTLVAQAQMRLLGYDTWQVAHVAVEENALAGSLAEHALAVGHDVDEPEAGAPRSSDGPTLARRVVVHVTHPPDVGTCREPCGAGEVFEFGDVTPPHICLYALETVLDVVMACKRDEGDTIERLPITKTCNQPGCGATFRIDLAQAARDKD